MDSFPFSLTASGKCFLTVIGTWSVGKDRKSLRLVKSKQLCIRIGSSVIASPRLVNLLFRYDFGKVFTKRILIKFLSHQESLIPHYPCNLNILCFLTMDCLHDLGSILIAWFNIYAMPPPSTPIVQIQVW